MALHISDTGMLLSNAVDVAYDLVEYDITLWGMNARSITSGNTSRYSPQQSEQGSICEGVEERA